MSEKQEVFEEMCMLKAMIEEHADDLRRLMREEFRDQWEQGKAYGVFDCTGSSNPYDVTIETLLESIAEEEGLDFV